MDLSQVKEKSRDLFHKYKYVLVILIVGLVFMMLPTRSTKTSDANIQTNEPSSAQSINEELEKILCCIQGAGQVRVMVTVERGEESVFQQNLNVSDSESGNSDKQDTVIISDSGRNEAGLLRQTISPVYQGALIVCQGADSAQVRLAIIDAVSKITGLGANQISVLKMK